MALSFEEWKPEIDSTLKCLHDFDDVTNEDVCDALSSLHDITFITFTDPKAYGLYLVSEGFGQLFLDLWQQLRKYLKKKNRGSDGHRNLEILMNVLWNTSCDSPDVADDLVGHGFVSIMLAVINVDGLDKKLLAGPILNILNCMIYRSKNNRSVYRDANAVTILQPLLKSKNVQIQTATLATLAYIVNEKEREILATSKSGLKQLIVLLKKGVKNEDHQAFLEGGIAIWIVLDTMDAINQLAINDTNKVEIERRGAIPAIIRMLQDDFSDDEHRVAVEALWNLSFVESIRQSKILQSTVPMLEKLSKSKSGEVQRVCESALWQIKGRKSENVWPSTSAEKPPPSYKEATTNPGFPTPAPAKVMLSYQWDHQKRVLKIRERLVNAGLRVWMDVSNMEGDILGAMANAVEESDVILMCMSERYRDSKSCRSEASYAYKLEKKIIPLRLEAEYTPDGWLGFLQGMDLYYACYSDEELDRNMPSLLKVIGGNHGNSASSGTDAVDGPITPQKHQISQATPPPRPPKQPAATYWSAQEVQNWLVAKKLKCPALDDFEGCDLQELFTSLVRDEEKFKDEIKSDYNMNGPTCTRFTAGLRQLFQQ